VVELIKYGRFCAKMRRKVAPWLQEEEYGEFVTELHWISLHGKGLCKGLNKREFVVRFCCECTEDALSLQQ
jgi:hypothetical protein